MDALGLPIGLLIAAYLAWRDMKSWKSGTGVSDGKRTQGMSVLRVIGYLLLGLVAIPVLWEVILLYL
jgi:hypothetical protein